MEPTRPSDNEINIAVYQGAVLCFATKYFGLPYDTAEDQLMLAWEKEDLSTIMSNHPFFTAGRLAGFENLATREKYIANQREIDHIWV